MIPVLKISWFFCMTRPRPPYRAARPSRIVGQRYRQVQAGTFWCVLNVSLRAYGAQLRLDWTEFYDGKRDMVQGGPTDLLWSKKTWNVTSMMEKHVTSLTRDPNWPLWWKKVTSLTRDSNLPLSWKKTSRHWGGTPTDLYDGKNVTSLTGDPKWPFRCLDCINIFSYSPACWHTGCFACVT